MSNFFFLSRFFMWVRGVEIQTNQFNSFSLDRNIIWFVWWWLSIQTDGFFLLWVISCYKFRLNSVLIMNSKYFRVKIKMFVNKSVFKIDWQKVFQKDDHYFLFIKQIVWPEWKACSICWWFVASLCVMSACLLNDSAVHGNFCCLFS